MIALKRTTRRMLGAAKFQRRWGSQARSRHAQKFSAQRKARIASRPQVKPMMGGHRKWNLPAAKSSPRVMPVGGRSFASPRPAPRVMPAGKRPMMNVPRGKAPSVKRPKTFGRTNFFRWGF